jgi:hypothetical protein
MKLYVRNMVCIRCKMIVRQELKKLSLHCVIVELGEIEIMENISPTKVEELNTALLKYGLELMDGRKGILIEKIKNYRRARPLYR